MITFMYFKSKYASIEEAEKELRKGLVYPPRYGNGNVYMVDHCANGPVIYGMSYSSDLFIEITEEEFENTFL